MLTNNISPPQKFKMHVKNISRVIGGQFTKLGLRQAKQGPAVEVPAAAVHIYVG